MTYPEVPKSRKNLTPTKCDVYLSCEELECPYHRVPGTLWCTKHSLRNPCKDLEL